MDQFVSRSLDELVQYQRKMKKSNPMQGNRFQRRNKKSNASFKGPGGSPRVKNIVRPPKNSFPPKTSNQGNVSSSILASMLDAPLDEVRKIVRKQQIESSKNQTKSGQGIARGAAGQKAPNKPPQGNSKQPNVEANAKQNFAANPNQNSNVLSKRALRRAAQKMRRRGYSGIPKGVSLSVQRNNINSKGPMGGINSQASQNANKMNTGRFNTNKAVKGPMKKSNLPPQQSKIFKTIAKKTIDKNAKTKQKIGRGVPQGGLVNRSGGKQQKSKFLMKTVTGQIPQTTNTPNFQKKNGYVFTNTGKANPINTSLRRTKLGRGAPNMPRKVNMGNTSNTNSTSNNYHNKQHFNDTPKLQQNPFSSAKNVLQKNSPPTHLPPQLTPHPQFSTINHTNQSHTSEHYNAHNSHTYIDTQMISKIRIIASPENTPDPLPAQQSMISAPSTMM